MQTESVKATAVQQGMRLATAKLIEALKDGKVGDVLTDEEMFAICERKTMPGGNGYVNLQSAIRHVEKNYGLVWRRVATAGCIKCLDGVERCGVLASNRRHIGKVSRRALVVGRSIQVDELPESERTEALVQVAQLQAVEHFSRTETTKRLVARKATAAPDMAKLLEVFAK
jgi:hypothetical protein